MIIIDLDGGKQDRAVKKYCRESRFQQIRREVRKDEISREEKRQLLAGVVAMAMVMFLCLAGLAVLVWLSR